MIQRSEKKLEKLRQDYQKLKREFAQVGHVLAGILQKRSYGCGRSYCRCQKGGPLHGPYYHWTPKVGGKTVSINLDEDAAAIVEEWIENRRKARKVFSQLQATSLEILKIITHIDTI